jgi:hypothetical protein
MNEAASTPRIRPTRILLIIISRLGLAQQQARLYTSWKFECTASLRLNDDMMRVAESRRSDKKIGRF